MDRQSSYHNLFERQLAVSWHGQHADHYPVLVFLHDALGSMAQWRDFPDRLAEESGLPAISYDRFGHGRSDDFFIKREKDYLDIEAAYTLPALLDRLELEDVILVGHSDGASIALLAAAGSVKRRIRGVLSLSAHIYVEDITRQGIEETISDATVLERLQKYHGNRDKTVELYRRWHETWLSDSFQDWNISAALADIVCPVLVIQGKDDEYASVQHAGDIAAGIRHGHLELIDDCRHFPHRDQPDQVSRLCTDFIAHLWPGPG